MKKQIVIVYGGTSFKTYEDYVSYLKNEEISLDDLKPHKKWRDTLSTELGDDYEILVPRMPNSNNAQYNEWKIYFSKIANVLNDEVVLIGNSLGGIFLAKYLSENTFPKKIRATILIAPPFDDIDSPDDRWSLMDFTLPVSLAKCAEQGGKIYLVYSQDDPIVSFAQLKKYQQALPSAQIMVFDNRQHFLHETFPEMVELIKLI